MAAVAAALAGTAGIAAYLDGKYHIIQDLKVQRNKKLAAKHLADLSALLYPLRLVQAFLTLYLLASHHSHSNLPAQDLSLY